MASLCDVPGLGLECVPLFVYWCSVCSRSWVNSFSLDELKDPCVDCLSGRVQESGCCGLVDRVMLWQSVNWHVYLYALSSEPKAQ